MGSMGEAPSRKQGDGRTPAIRSDQLATRFGELLAESGDGLAVPTFPAIWSAFVALAAIPVKDVSSPGTDDDSIGVSVGPEEREAGPRVTLRRYVVRPWGNAVDLYVIADFEPFPLAAPFYALGVGGADTSVRAFVETVQGSAVFSQLKSARPRQFAYGLASVE